MPGYISSTDNRFYVAAEQSYGAVAAITNRHRIPAVSLGAKQQKEKYQRRDKTGGRTFPGVPAGIRRQTSYDLKTYMTGWTDHSTEPGYGPLFAAGMGAAGQLWAGGTVQTAPTGTQIQFSAAHHLSAGQALTFGGELRFVTAVVDGSSIQVNAPFTISPTAGSHVGGTVTYVPGDTPSSVSVFDYWSPASSVQRIVRGAGVDRMKIEVNDDFHEFEFSGPACDLIDSSSFNTGDGALTQYPPEPALENFDYTIVPGHLGQAWMGTSPTMFATVTAASFLLDNAMDVRAREFGSQYPVSIVPGRRSVTVELSLYEQDSDATQELYQAARQGSPVSVMFQLGQQQNQLFGIYLKAVVPEVPEFDDRETRLQWKFSGCRAQGTADDEIYIAFG